MLIMRAVETVALTISKQQIVSVNFVGPRVMARINTEYVGHEGLTDVISFCYNELDSEFDLDEEEVAIELFISPDFAFSEAEEREDSTYGYELALYVVHGLLHAKGYDDLTIEDAKVMRQMESSVMGVLIKEFDFDQVFNTGNYKC